MLFISPISNKLLVYVSDVCAPHKDADIVFVVDASLSQGNHRSSLIKDFVLNFISNFSGFPIGPDHFQFALVTFSFEANVMFHLDAYTDNVTLVAAVENMTASLVCSGPSNVHTAFDAIRETVFLQSNGARDNVGRYVIVISDGLFSQPVQAVTAARALRLATGAKIYGIATGDQVLQRGLVNVAHSPRHVFALTEAEPVESVLRETTFDCKGKPLRKNNSLVKYLCFDLYQCY